MKTGFKIISVILTMLLLLSTVSIIAFAARIEKGLGGTRKEEFYLGYIQRQ